MPFRGGNCIAKTTFVPKDLADLSSASVTKIETDRDKERKKSATKKAFRQSKIVSVKIIEENRLPKKQIIAT